MTDSRCVSCQHYHTIDNEYAWCHECTMNNDHYKPMDELKKQETTDINIGKWISVKDRLPEAQGEYLISDNFKATVGWFSGENSWIGLDGSFYADGVVTHWMPLPEQPKEET